MKIKACELQEGQRIRIEYGDEGNWVALTIKEIHRLQNMVIVAFHLGSTKPDVSFRPDEEVEVLYETRRPDNR